MTMSAIGQLDLFLNNVLYATTTKNVQQVSRQDYILLDEEDQ